MSSRTFGIEINFEICDATEFKVDKKSIIFIFNSFGYDTMKKMITNNLDFLRQSKSLILYANDHHINLLEEYGNVINRDDTYNLSCIQF